MGNKKVLSKATRELNKTKRFAAPKNIIEDPRGQWAHPGEITRIPSDKITMQGVPYPVMAYPNMGEPQMMYPGQDYVFPGADYVDEYPQMKRGGTPKSLVKMPKPSKKGLASKKFSRSLEATNRLFTENPLFAKPKSKKRKVFDPNAVYQDGGIMDQEEPTGGITSQEEIDAANRAMMRARLAYAQMHGNSAAQRMVVAPDQPYVYTGEEYDKDWDMPVGVPAGETGTHYMASFGNYAVPFIQQGPNGLQFNESPSIRDREAIRFDSEADAEYFGGHYKEVAPDKSYRRKIENGSPYITSLSPEDEEEFQRFYNTLPENLQSDDPSYDIRGYWDSEGRPEEFDYSQPKEDDGYYHAYSINQNTGEYLKNPWHPTFQHAIDEDKKIGYRPVVNVKGELIATENPSIADPEEQTFLRNIEGPANYVEAELTPEEIEEYRKGGFIVEDISVPSLNQMQTGGDASCPPGYVKIGGKCVPAGNQPTFQDSLDVYNMQMKQNAYYNKHKKYFRNINITRDPASIAAATNELTSGETRNASIASLRRDYENAKNYYNIFANALKNVPPALYGKEKEKYIKNMRAQAAENKKKMTDIRSAIAEHYPSSNNRHYYKDIIYGAIDPNAPVSYYHDQIKPQGIIARDSQKQLGKFFDGVDVTTLYYDPLAIRPAKFLSDAEIKKRYEKYGESGIPESRLKRLNLTEKKPTVQQQTTTKKPTVQQYPKEYKPVVNNVPKSAPEGKKIVGEEEVQQLDSKTGKVTTVINPVYEDLEKPIPTLHPTRVNPTITGELRKFVGEEEPGTDSDVMPVYDETDIEEGTPGPGGHWEDKSSRYIDWDGNSIAFNGIRFRRPGHGGDLIRKGKRHYIHYPSIEKRYDAWIEPDELPEEEYQEGGSPDPKTNFYTVEGSGGVYRKVNGKWEVDWNRSGNFQPLSKGDVKERSAILNKKAQPLYDATYDDLYATQRSAYTAAPKPTPAKKPTAQNKAAQEQFDKNFQVTGKSKMEVVEDKIQKTADDYAKYHQEQTGKPLTQEEYDDAYQDIYNRAYVDAGVYKPTMSGPTINPYGTTEERKNLVSLDPGKAPKNLTLGDYVDKGWDVVTNPLDYASYALKPKGTVTTPWNMTNYENRLEAAGLEDPVTANNNVNKGIDFASYFIGPGMVAQGLKMVPGTVNSIGRAFENPSWENTGDALFDAGMTALSIAPGFGIAKNLGKPASTLDDLRAIEALKGNTATTPFQSYYLTGNRALGTSEAAVQQAEALRKFTGQQPLGLPAGEYQFFNSDYKKLYDELQEAIKKQKIESDELANFDPIAKINQSKVDNKAFKDLIMGDDLKFKFDDYPDSPRIPVRYAGLEQIRPGSGPMSLNRIDLLPMGTTSSKNPLDQIANLIRRKKSQSELSALDDLDTIRAQSRTGQENAANILDEEIEQKLKDLDTPEGRRRVEKYIKDNNLVIEEYDRGNFDVLVRDIDDELPAILSNKYSDESRRIVDLVRNNMIANKRSPELMANIKSWNELEPEHILNNPLLNRIAVTDVLAPADPRFTGGMKQRPFTHEEYIQNIENIVLEDVELQIKEKQALIKLIEANIKKLAVEKNKANSALKKAKLPDAKQLLQFMADYNKKILDEHNKIAFINKDISNLTDRLERNNASFIQNVYHNNDFANLISIGQPYTAIGDIVPTIIHETGHATESVGLKRGQNSAIDRELIAGLDFAKRAPNYLYKKLDPDKVRETAAYDISFDGVDKYRDPKEYFRRSLSYFKKGNKSKVGMSKEPTAFAVEMRPALKELGLIKGNYDIVTPEIIEQLYIEYLTNPKFQFRDIRIFDIIKPTKRSFKQLAKSYNDIKSLLPYAVPVGLGVGATGLAGQEEMQQDMEYQDGGIIMELSDDEIQQYANGGFVVEELEYRPDAGKTLNKKVAAKPKTTINTEGLAYRPSASTKPQNPNAKANVQTNPSQQRQQNVQVPKPKVITDSMSTVLDKYAIGDTSPIMSIDVFQDIVTKQNQEKQAKLELLQRQLEASQAGTSNPNPAKRKQPSIKQYEFTEEFIKGMPNVRTEQSESYLGGRPLKNEVKKVVLHHTGSTDEKNNNKYVHNHFMNPDSETSAHVVIEEDGTRTIYASPDQVTFHAGKSTWDGRTNVNDFGVGIEFQGDTNVKPLTSAQIRSFVEYFDQLAKKYNVSTQDIITHAMIAPGRKPDITESQYKRILKYLKERGYE